MVWYGMVWYGMVWYGILGFNVPLDTVYVISLDGSRQHIPGCSAVGRRVSNPTLQKTFLHATETALETRHNEAQQEAQLSLTNRATRLEVSRGHQTWYHSIR